MTKPGGEQGTASRREHLGYLDGWRGIAILAVLAGHFLPVPAIEMGRLGVELFFALSGRLMAQILFVDQLPLRTFIFRRFSRIWPALFVFVACLFLIAQMIVPSPIGPVSPATALSVLTFTFGYLQNLAIPGQHAMEHTWSLAVEEHTYLILSLVALATGRIIGKVRLAIACIAALSIADGWLRSLVFGQSYYDAYWVTDSRLASICLPALVYLYREDLLLKLRPAAWLVTPLCGGLGILLFYHRIPTEVRLGFAPLLIGLAVTFLPHAPRALLAALEWRLPRRFGLMSYSIYLWQQPFMAMSDSKGLSTHLLMLIALFAPATISYYAIEQPARRWLNAWWSAGTFKLSLKPALTRI